MSADTAYVAAIARPDCAVCRAGLANQAEQDRRAHADALEAFDAETLALLAHAEQQAAAIARVAREAKP